MSTGGGPAKVTSVPKGVVDLAGVATTCTTAVPALRTMAL